MPFLPYFYKIYMKRENALPPGRAPCLVGPLAGLWCPSSAIWCVLTWKKSEGSFRDEAPPSRGGTWRNQSRAPAELFCRGNFPPGGGNHRHHHHQQLSHLGEGNIHQHLQHQHLLSNPSSSLVFNLCTRTLHLVVDYYMVYLVEYYMFRSNMLFNTPMILIMIIVCE